MARIKIEPETLFDVRLLFRNFSGKPDSYNSQGGRIRFGAILDPDKAEELESKGWKIKQLAPREEGQDFLYYLPVNINFHPPFGKEPDVYKLIEGSNKLIKLDEESIKSLDKDELVKVDIEVSPYVRGTTDKVTVTAWLTEGYFTIKQSRLQGIYGNYEVPDELPFE